MQVEGGCVKDMKWIAETRHIVGRRSIEHKMQKDAEVDKRIEAEEGRGDYELQQIRSETDQVSKFL
jgi:hypothetical protein